MNVFDEHIHLVRCKNLPNFSDEIDYTALDCALSESEFVEQSELIASLSSRKNIHIKRSFGIHPWDLRDCPECVDAKIDFLRSLLEQNKIDAVGECGLDFFDDKLKACKSEQTDVFITQLELAEKYGKTVVIHGRKCMAELMTLRSELKAVPKVIFHGWSGTFIEAEKLLEGGVNAYFSFGKELLKGRKKSIECVKNLDRQRILTETDGPYQTLKGEETTSPEHILKVIEAIKLIRAD